MPDSNTNPPRKIAVLGGGLGALSAVYAMTDYEGWRNHYEITVYQMGWRLGGKAASGRNDQLGQRIEEHGLHVMMGFYENLFKMMRAAYDECRESNLMPGSPFQDWTDAFKPHDLTSNMENVDGRGWIPWSTQYPRNDRLPGSPGLETKNPTPFDYLTLGMEWLVVRYDEAWQHTPPDEPVEHRLPLWIRATLDLLGLGEKLAAGLKSLLHLALEVLRALGSEMEKIPGLHLKALAAIIDHFLEPIREAWDSEPNDKLRRLFIELDIGGAMLRGMIEDDIINRGFDSINHLDFSYWLASHGCKNKFGGVIQSFYDGNFAYLDGDAKKPLLAAGVALNGLFRILLTYGTSIFWLMQAGMGDTIVAPLYLLLKKRGVKFKFFHRVQNLALSPNRAKVSAIEINIQATVKNGEYNPLFQTPDGLYCWPAETFFDQLNDGDKLKGYNLESAWCTAPTIPLRLESGIDFDEVLFGLSIGSVRFVCPELLAASQRWRDMVDNIQTIQTRALQVWFNKTAIEMGWNPWSDGTSPEGAEPAQATSYIDPFNSWGDMSHLISKEFWPASANVQQIAYFCNPMPAVRIPPLDDPGYPKNQIDQVRLDSLDFLTTKIKPWFPAGAQPDKPDTIDWNLLVDTNNGVGEARLDAQFLRVNIDPSERYVLSVPDSPRYRLHSGDTGFSNLFICGDWIYTYLNGGCAEAAVMSGLFASVAICGKPDTILGAFGIPEPPSSFTMAPTGA